MILCLGIMVLGQTPRTDLETIYSTHLPGIQLAIVGALDGKTAADIDHMADSGGEYPLLVMLGDGTTREISMFRLLPLLEEKAVHLGCAGAQTAVLMCAGNFPDLRSPIPVIYPGRVVPAVVSGISQTRRIGIITPNAGQLVHAQDHWKEKGFTVQAVVASPKNPMDMEAAANRFQDSELDMVVLDCMGFGPKDARLLQQKCGLPVICSQSLVARVAAEIMGC